MAMFEPHVQPEPDRENDVRSTGARIEIRPSARVAYLAERSLACPECGVPIRLSGPVGWHELISCAFCEAEAPTRDFIHDQGWPAVDLIARVR